MRRQPTRKVAAVIVPRQIKNETKKRIARIPRKPAQAKWLQTAQMPDYLAEEHPELCD